MNRTHHGSCHCGAVRFEVELDLASDTSKCNCSICAKSRFWKSVVRADAFRLLGGADALSEYRFGTGGIRHQFCSRCGVKTFGRGRIEDFGDFVAVGVACLDDVSPEELARAPVRYEDGRNNRWESAPAETRHL
jgi:hypothetical protein